MAATWSSRQPSSKWVAHPDAGTPPRGAFSLAPRGALLYVPLAISLGLNALWLQTSNPRAPPKAELVPQEAPFGVPELNVNGRPCGGALLADVRRHLSDVVLIVSFADDATATNASGFVKELYGRIFHRVVVCAPSENETLGIEGRGARSWGKNLAYQYYFFPKIAARYSQAAGFLWASADVVINYWTLVSADKDRLWLTDIPGQQHLYSFDAIPASYSPLESVPQKKAIRAALRRVEPEYWSRFNASVKTLLPQAQPGKPTPDGEEDAASAVPQDVYPTRVSDIFYVPQRLALPLALDLLPAFRDFSVFQDIAIPSMFLALESPSEYDPVLAKVAFTPRNERAAQWTKEVAAYHPWDLSTLQLRGALLRVLGQGDDCLREILEAAKS